MHVLIYTICIRNCHCTHLMQYVLAKMIFATKRMQQNPDFNPLNFSVAKSRLLCGDKKKIKETDYSRRSDDDLIQALDGNYH